MRMNRWSEKKTYKRVSIMSNAEAAAPREVEIPDIPLGRLMEDAAAKYPGRTAMIFLNKKFSYSQVDRQIRQFMNILRSMGVNKGDVVALMSPNCPQAIIAFQAVMRIGAILTQLNPLYVEREVEHQLKDSGAKVAVVANLMAPVFSRAMERTGVEKTIIFKMQDYMAWPINWLAPLKWRFAEKRDLTLPAGPKFFMWDQLMRGASDIAQDAQVAPEDVALYQYTGGTTGTSKGVILTHRNLVANATQAKAWIAVAKEGEDTMILALPIFHVFGLTAGMNLGFILAMTLVVIPKFEAAEVMGLIQKHKASFFPGVPLMYQKINENPDTSKYDISSIKFCLSGAAALPRATKEKFEQLTGGKLVEAYGLTEASPGTHCNPILSEGKTGSIGLPLPSTASRIVDLETGQDAKTGQMGELYVRGPQVMRGYKGAPQETSAVLNDGWLRTGDMGYVDEDGFVFLMDRKKEMILAHGGYNVYPKELEEVLRELEGVADVAIVGEPHPEKGEQVVAAIVRKEGSHLTAEEVIEYSRKNMAAYKMPRRVEFFETLPRTIIGKVLKREIKNLLRERAV